MGLLSRLAKSKAIQEGLEDVERTLPHTEVPNPAIGEETQAALKNLNTEANGPNPLVQDVETAQGMRDVANQVDDYKSPVSQALDRYKQGTHTPEDLQTLAQGMGEKQLPSAENPIDVTVKSKTPITAQGETQILPSEEKGLVPTDKSVAKTPDAVLEPETSRELITKSQPEDILSEPVNKSTQPPKFDSKNLGNASNAEVLAMLGIGGAGGGAAYLASRAGGSDQPPQAQKINVSHAQASQATPDQEDENLKNAKNEVEKQIVSLQAETEKPKSSKAFINDLLQAQGTTLGTDENLKAAQAQRDQEHGFNTLGRAADMLTGAAFHTGPTMEKFYDQQDKFAERHIQDLQDRIANEKNDPNSSVSKAFNQILSEFGVKAEGLSGAAIEKIAPWVEKKYLADEARKGKLEDLKLKYHEIGAAQQVKADEKDRIKTDDRFTKVNQKITSEIASGRSAFGIAAKNLQSVQNAQALMDGTLDYNTLDPREVYELGRVLDRVLSQGSPSIAGSTKLTPETARMKVAKWAEWLSNNRQGAGAGDFVKRYQKTFDREANVAKQQIQSTAGKILSTEQDLAQKNPDKWDAMMTQHGLPSDIFQKAKDKQTQELSAPGKSANGPKKTVIKKGYNAKTDQTQLIYSDGSKDIVQGKQ